MLIWFQRESLPVCERGLVGFSLLLFPSFGRVSSAHDTSDHCLADDFATCRYAAAATIAAGGNANFIATFGFAAAAGRNFPAIEPASGYSGRCDEWRRANKDFKPSAAVAAKLDELKWRDSEALEMWSAGELDQAAMSLEFERNAVHRHLLMVSLL